MRALSLFASMLIVTPTLAGCGYSDEEMMAKQRRIDKLTADLAAAREQIADDDAKFSQVEAEMEQIRDEIQRTGLEATQRRP